MNIKDAQISGNGKVGHLSHVPITSSDFKFVYHTKPEQFFKIRNRSFNLIKTRPSLTIFSNVLYTPATRSTRPFDGCLYDENLQRIDTCCIKRGRYDKNYTIGDQYFQGDKNNLQTYEPPVLYLGYINPHYGHFLLESLSRWWALIEECGNFDNYLLHVHHPKVLDLPFIRSCISAMHLDTQKIVYFSKPTKINHVIVPEVSFQLESHVYTIYKKLCETLISNIHFDDSVKTDQPVYVSRRLLKSGVSLYKGEEKIEEFLSKRGAIVIHPQLLPFSEQVRLFNKHSQIIGIAGSAMHNIVLTENPKNVFYITPHWINPNCFLIDKCFEISSTYIQSCYNLDRLRIFIGKGMRKLKIGKINASNYFINRFNLDSAKVINWFRKSGHL